MRWIWLGLLIFFSTSQATQVLTWQDSIELAAQNNAELKAAEEVLQSARHQEGVARSGFLPQLSANLDYERGTSGGGQDNTGNTSDAIRSQSSASIEATQNLFAGFQDIAKVRQARANTAAALANLQIVQAKISYDLKNAFESVLFAKASLSLAQKTVQRRRDNFGLVELRFDSGRENKGSVLLSQANLEEARFEVLQAQNALRVALANLAKAVGVDEIFGDVMGEIPTQEPPSNTPNFHTIALTTPEYYKINAQAESVKESVTLARAPFFPAIDLTGDVDKSGSKFFPEGERGWSVGVNFSWPFFSGGKDYYGTHSARAKWVESLNNQTTTRRQVLANLESTYAAFVEAVVQLKVDDSFQQAAVMRSDIAKNKYDQGLLDFEDWDIIENDLISRQKNYLQSKKNRVVTEALWEQAQGRGVIP